MIHCLTRKRDLVDTFFKLGMSVSYDRMLEIFTSMANDSCRRFVQEDIVCPTNLLQHVFTSSAVNNIDHNPSSISSKDSFIGTAALKGEFKCLKHVADNSSVRVKVGTSISWSAYHAAVLPDGNKLPAVSALQPLFPEQAKSVAMIRH
ncbi:Hypothetical predicted protein [Mytilus galloprovincialis]|uniref:Uncharacterized protein n=1 Tax=Mytilus galloprovincialis TaxID=29158 RepID=A0A8B6HQ53_MYTGA|nr:Hypothetical predicted protein [Mytilus galloprovincialis]